MAGGGYDIGASLSNSSSAAADNSGATSATGGGGGQESGGLSAKPNTVPWIVGGVVVFALAVLLTIFIAKGKK